MAIDPQAKYQEMLAKRAEHVQAVVAAYTAKEELHRAARQGEKDYAATIAEAVKGGVPLDDLKALGLDIPESIPKRVSKQRRPLEVPEGRRPRGSQEPSGWATVAPDGSKEEPTA